MELHFINAGRKKEEIICKGLAAVDMKNSNSIFPYSFLHNIWGCLCVCTDLERGVKEGSQVRLYSFPELKNFLKSKIHDIWGCWYSVYRLGEGLCYKIVVTKLLTILRAIVLKRVPPKMNGPFI